MPTDLQLISIARIAIGTLAIAIIGAGIFYAGVLAGYNLRRRDEPLDR